MNLSGSTIWRPALRAWNSGGIYPQKKSLSGQTNSSSDRREFTTPSARWNQINWLTKTAWRYCKRVGFFVSQITFHELCTCQLFAFQSCCRANRRDVLSERAWALFNSPTRNGAFVRIAQSLSGKFGSCQWKGRKFLSCCCCCRDLVWARCLIFPWKTPSSIFSSWQKALRTDLRVPTSKC